MDPKLFAMVFGSIFVAELGDKTQLATLLYAADARNPKLTVFLAAASALVLSAALGVMAGSFLTRTLSEALLSRVAGLGFVAIGAWMLWRA